MLVARMTLLLSFSGDQVWIKELHMGTKVARGGFVMVNFMHHIVWALVQAGTWVPVLVLVMFFLFAGSLPLCFPMHKMGW